MFRRLIFDPWVGIFALTAFITAASVYVSVVWRALRMGRAQVDRFAQLPLEDETVVRGPAIDSLLSPTAHSHRRHQDES